MENQLTAKDKIILIDVEPLKDQQSGFKVHDESKHHKATVFAVPSDSKLQVGETVILREKAISEKLVYGGVTYHFVQNLDILCGINGK